MVEASIDERGYTGHIVLKPNLSLSWRTNKRLFLFITMITAFVAGHFIRIGGWMVLPFSGLELLLIGMSTWMFFCRYNTREVIRFTDNTVIIERGKNTAEKTWEYPRHWSQIHIREHGAYDIPAVCIRSHGKELELGKFLGYDEKLVFIRLLKDITREFQKHMPGNVLTPARNIVADTHQN
jgi:uncharacterized membrane protein